jgi:hypothetical protein
MSIYAQKEIIKVTPDVNKDAVFTKFGNLNDTVAYVAANQGCGNVIFELERDAFYFSIDRINPLQQDYHVRTEEGDGARPVIRAAPHPVDGNFDQIFYEFTGNITLEGLHISGITTEGSQQDQALRTDAENLRVIVRDCLIEQYRDRALRMNNAGTKAYFYDCIIRNMGEQESGGVFVRVNTYCDTLVVNNCTLYNLNNYLFQNTRNGLNYFEVTNNTFMNWATSDNRGVDVGRAKEALIADNVFYNGAFNRNNTVHDPFFVANTMEDSDLPWSDAERDIKILKNNWYVDDEVAGIYDKYYDAARDTLTREVGVIVGQDTVPTVVPYQYIVGDVWIEDGTLLGSDTLWDDRLALAMLQDTGIVTFEGNFKEELSFANPPAYPELHVMVKLEFNWDGDLFEPVLELISLDSDTMYWVTDDVENPFHFGYNEDALSATAGRDGGQIGADWELVPVVGIGTAKANENELSLYPNPASYILNIENDFNSLQIFDMTGKQVYQSRDNSVKVLNVSNLREGLYIIAITDMNNQKRIAKFVKK